MGDCLGAPVEGLSAGAIRQRFGRIQTLLPGPHMRDAAGDRQGMYTDDMEPGTPCSLAVIVSLQGFLEVDGEGRCGRCPRPHEKVSGD